MKKLHILIGLLLISCNQTNQPCDNEIKSNGFIADTEQGVMLASNSAVDLFKAIDKAWFDRDLSLIHI